MHTATSNRQHLGALLYDLIELEYDTQAAFEAAIARLTGQAYKEQLRQFLADQQRHILDLKAVAAPLCDALPHGPDSRRILTKGLLMLAHLAGDRAILHALGSTLDAMNEAYERALTEDVVTPEALGVVQRHFLDERRHRDWLMRCLHPEEAQRLDENLDDDPAFFDLNGRPPVSFQSPKHP
jgi:hypothetical protein